MDWISIGAAVAISGCTTTVAAGIGFAILNHGDFTERELDVRQVGVAVVLVGAAIMIFGKVF